METVAGIDLGTQSIKVVLYDFNNKIIIANESCSLSIIAENDGTREQKTEWYKEALKTCFSAFKSSDLQTIKAIGVSGQQHGFVPLDKEGNALYNIKLWNDTSTAAQCSKITTILGGEQEVIKELGNLMLPGFTAPKILWLKENHPEAFAKLHYILLPHDYINFLLTNQYVMEAGDASGTALFDSKTKQWSKSTCDAIDETLYSMLPPIIESHTECGTVQKSAAEEYGIPEGIPVSSGGGDNMMGAIGTGSVADGFLTMSLGTSGTLYGYSDTPISDPQEGLSGFCSSTGGWLPLLCTMNCTVATEQIRTLFELGVKEFDALAEQSVPGANGVTVLPYFNGERSPNLPNGRASITGLTTANSSRNNICRAAMESAIYAMRGGLDSFRKLGFQPKEIRLIGGGAKSPLWRQIAADVLNLPIRIPQKAEAAALGAAVQALWCLNCKENPTITTKEASESIQTLCKTHISLDETKNTDPVLQNVKKYNEAYTQYNNLVQQLTPLYK
ncbi:MAG: xylulokinase [Treponema sp. CETP13]|nr:MAG: xylulokinase [Treponema sp. CETP13]